MSATILDGGKLARELSAAAAARAADIKKLRGRPPSLAVVAVGEDPAARVYIRRQARACEAAGIESLSVAVPGGATEAEVISALEGLSADERVDGILVSAPLPAPLSLRRVLSALPAGKDVDGLGQANAGLLYSCKTMAEVEASGALLPATAAAIVELLKSTGARVSGAQAVVIGRSSVVGRPAAHLLSCMDATVTLCHSRTPDVEAHARRADILVAAAGLPGFVRGSWIKPGAVVIDAGISVAGGRVAGDVEPSAAGPAAFLTPVPGGVGPVTTAMLLSNVSLAAGRRAGLF